MEQANYATGMRVEIRNAEWAIRKVDRSSDGGQLLTCDGVSEIVRGKNSCFLTLAEKEITVLDPKETVLQEDDSSNFNASKLYIESKLRERIPTGQALQLGHKAAMDTLPFQLEPTYNALGQPRQRVLIADAVGLGKTLEAGILMSELIRRGRGKRILVLAVKSMLTQFQKEMWSRFSIPLTRLDSVGLQGVRNRIPANHNPFNYYDKAIISIDTLKQDIEYRHHLENARWDIIVIDEAHNVALRGSRSRRHRLASLLANRSDTLILLSATPHDGKPESFASLVDMLDPTAIANHKKYKYDDFKDKNLVVRRFKKDVKDQIAGEFPEREIKVVECPASSAEEWVYDTLVDAKFEQEEGRKGTSRLLKIGFEKTLFSSPMACFETVCKRLEKLQKQNEKGSTKALVNELNELHGLQSALANIGKHNFGKYQQLLGTIKNDLKWRKTDASDRLVIFTESIPTLKFLYESLKEDLNLNPDQIGQLRGDMSDIELMSTVEQFGQANAKVRLLVCSDVASEGINLHHQSYKMIHFDIPWSLMVFQQRNGRIDRYGQEHQPQIRYLVTTAENEKIRGDARIQEVLIEKDQQAQDNIGDASEFTRCHDKDSEEQIIVDALANQEDSAAFLDELFNSNAAQEQDEAFYLSNANQGQTEVETDDGFSLYANDIDYCLQGLKLINAPQVERTGTHSLQMVAPNDLKHRYALLPKQIQPTEANKYTIRLSQDINDINKEIKRCRGTDEAWPQLQYLWAINPVMEWLSDKLRYNFGRKQAPVVRANGRLAPGEDHFVLSGLFPNRRSHAVLNPWLVVSFNHGELTGIESIEQFVVTYPFHQWELANPVTERQPLRQQGLLGDAIDQAIPHFCQLRDERQQQLDQQLMAQTERLRELRQNQQQQLELSLADSKLHETRVQNTRKQALSRIENVFEEHQSWIKDTMQTDPNPYIQVIAVLTGEEA
ncbi:DEAD/DEAH box helicase [Ferrimonas sediminicola]|uniref:DEAD/DEAH box helicase n=1 Tax=Ferrimonas sediminicola TaxID=2569538 RepID=A0A4U1BAZ5_9GAMM|nr:DEAD/DEAH box helicase [Ferrimonas sediminicola]TKB47989.1 DEAD/DEAH box helicase [Ferrimonas sediminicola]